MTINTALSNAYSGLAANARQAEVVSRNVANATVEGHAARKAEASTLQTGGLRIGQVQRMEDVFATAARRLADGTAARDGATARAMEALADLAAPGDSGRGLDQAVTQMLNGMRALADTPESVTFQAQVLGAAQSVARTLNTLSAGAQTLRLEADADIARQVETVNRALNKIEDLNRKIATAVATGRDATAMQDERARQIDLVNGIIPIRVSGGDDGRQALYTSGGGVLLDGAAPQLAFTPSGVIAASDTLGTGGLSDVALRGIDSAPTAPTNNRTLAGGSLEAAFRVRDEIAPGFSAQIDALAAELMTRLQAGGTFAPGEGALFVDGGPGGPLLDLGADPAQQVGLAGRIAVNPLADPAQGGELRRIRDGVNAATPGLPSDATQVRAMLDALTVRQLGPAPVSADSPFPTVTTLDPSGFDAANSFVGRVEAVISLRERAAASASTEAAFAVGAQTAMRDNELSAVAVDTDAELQDLLRIEKAYAANARVMQTADEMLNRILEI